jgi:hypothetical protein
LDADLADDVSDDGLIAWTEVDPVDLESAVYFRWRKKDVPAEWAETLEDTWGHGPGEEARDIAHRTSGMRRTRGTARDPRP